MDARRLPAHQWGGTSPVEDIAAYVVVCRDSAMSSLGQGAFAVIGWVEQVARSAENGVDGVLNATSCVGTGTDGVPDATSCVGAGADGVPNAASCVGAGIDGVPNAMSCVGEGIDGVPDATSCVGEGIDGVPDATSCVGTGIDGAFNATSSVRIANGHDSAMAQDVPYAAPEPAG